MLHGLVRLLHECRKAHLPPRWGPPPALPPGCMKNVLVVWGGILQGDIVTARELQVRGRMARHGGSTVLLRLSEGRRPGWA